MYCVTLLYPNKIGAKFDYDYFLDKHLPLAAKLFGNEIQVRKGVSTVDGSSVSYLCVANIKIKSIEDFTGRMMQLGPKLAADVPNYTNIEPIMQFDEILR